MTYQASHYPPHDFRPPKRRHTGLWVAFGIITGLIAVAFVSCAALVGGVSDSVQQQSEAKPTGNPSGQTGTKRDTRLDRNKPTAVKVGQAVTKGRHRLEAGWSVRPAKYLDTFELVGVEVTNVSDQASAATLDVKLYKGPKLLGDVSCHSPALEPGESAELDCFTGDEFVKGWDRVTVGATF
jgi:hypothetical protein